MEIEVKDGTNEWRRPGTKDAVREGWTRYEATVDSPPHDQTTQVKADEPELIGNPTDGFTIKYAVTDKPDADIAEAVRQKVNALRDAELASLAVEFDGVNFDADPSSIQNVTGAATLGVAGAITEIDWITTDNDTVTLSAAKLLELGGVMASEVAAIMHKARSIKDNVSKPSDIVW